MVQIMPVFAMVKILETSQRNAGEVSAIAILVMIQTWSATAEPAVVLLMRFLPPVPVAAVEVVMRVAGLPMEPNVPIIAEK